MKRAGWGLRRFGECVPYPRRAAVTWFPPIAATWEWSLVLPSLPSSPEKQGCHVCLCRLHTAERCSADRIAGLWSTVRCRLKHLPSPGAGAHDLGSRRGLDFSPHSCPLCSAQSYRVENGGPHSHCGIPPYPCPWQPRHRHLA